MVRFGWNLAQLFRYSPWSSNPGYTQIQQINKSTSPSLTALLYSVSQTILAEIALFFSSQTSSLIPFLLCHGQNLTCFDLFCFKNTFVKCYLIQLLLKILLLLIPLSLAPSHYPSPAQPFPFPLICSSPCFFLLLFLLSFIACAWKEDWSTQVLSSCQWTSLIKWQGGHHHFCMTISLYCNPSIPHWATACFPPPMLTALPVTNLVDSGNISLFILIGQ